MTRLTPEQVKPFILHPERMVRDAAARYFADSYLPDPTVMPLVVQAYEKYGLAEAFNGAFAPGRLVQTAETVDWLIAAVPRAPARSEYGLRKALVDADPALLLSRREAVLKALVREPLSVANLKLRLEVATWDGDRLWQRLAELCEAAELENAGYAKDWDAVELVVDALGRQGDRHAARTLDILARRFDPEALPTRDVWLLAAAVRLAGDLRLAAAVPHIVAHMRYDWELLDVEAEQALIRIGTDDAVRAIGDGFADADDSTGFKIYGCSVLGNIHTDLALETCLRLFEAEEVDSDHKDFLGNAVLEHLSPEGTCRMLAAVEAEEVGNETAYGLPAVCAMLGIETPLVAELRAGYLDTQKRIDGMAVPRSSPAVSKPSAFDLPPLSQALPIQGKTADAGRNDKCPCGSGKKYKKCCLGKKKM